eukprot:TCONS_00015937-protein
MGEEKLLNGGGVQRVDKTRMGVGSWRPDWLQKFNSMKWFLLALSLASFVQAITVGGITAVNLQTLETEFGLTSKSTGLIMTGNDISGLLLVTVVSFFGTKASKPKWMGIGSVITGLGIALFALPKLMIGKYEGASNQEGFDPTCQASAGPQGDLQCNENGGGTIGHMAVFMISQLLMGIGTTPLYTLGPTYLDENVSPRAAPVYLGIWFCCTMLGPPIGMIIGGMFLRIHTDMEAPEGVAIGDPRWVGAWWLGYVAFFGIFIIAGFFLFLFPKRLNSKQAKKREKSIKMGQLPGEEQMKFTFKGYLKSMFSLCKNRVFMLIVFGTTVRMLYTIGMFTFLIKILILKFGVAPSKAGQSLGFIMMPSLIVGVMLGAVILRRAKIEIAAQTAAKICVIVSVITIGSSFAFLIPGCRNTNIAGIMEPYHNHTEVTGSIASQCNSDCHCKKSLYLPICGSDGRTYHSPCHAGCTKTIVQMDKDGKIALVFGNCGCFPGNHTKSLNIPGVMQPPPGGRPGGLPSSNSTTVANQQGFDMSKLKSMSREQKMALFKQMGIMRKAFFNEATVGKCDRDCKNFILFIICTLFFVMIAFVASTPNKIMVLRSVPDNQRSFALGTQFVIMRGLSFLPGPIIVGGIVDSNCISWGYDKCGKKTNCLDYDIDAMSWTLVWLGFITSAVGTVLYFLAWWWYPVTSEKVSMNALIKEDGGVVDEEEADENENV